MPEPTPKFIHIRGARTHNLRDVSLDIPRDKLVVITGLSGSGKSSLAFDTIYAEGQRKYVESLSAYARQFLGQMVKPDVNQITGLPPTIAIAQQSVRANPRSTVATATELYDFLRLLFARVGRPTCPKCGRPVARQTRAQIVDAILALPEQTKVMILAPLVRGQKGEHKAVMSRIQREGFVRIRIDGELYEAKEAPKLDAAKPHRIDAVIDRIIVKPDQGPAVAGVRSRVAESVETSLKVADGLVVVASAAPGEPDRWRNETYSERFACPDCDIRLPPLEPRLFSFNSPHGACPECDGLGIVLEFDPAAVVPDASLPLEAGAIAPWGRSGKGLTPIHAKLLKQFCEAFKVPPGAAYSALSAPLREILLWGTKEGDEAKHGHHFEGVIPNLKRRWANADSDALKTRLHEFMSQRPCPSCKGARLRPEALAVRIDGRNIDEIAALSIDAAAGVFSALTFGGPASPTRGDATVGRSSAPSSVASPLVGDAIIAAPIVREIRQRLQFMIDVGIGYLTLSRSAATLSGGEAQRIRLATQVGSGLVGVCYVLDEPTIGLHQRDNARLIRSLRQLTDLGNTVLVVEHDVEAIDAADWIVNVGPGAGAHGGRILVNGPRAELLASKESITAQYLRGELSIAMPSERRPVTAKKAIEIKGAAENNLKSIDVRFPLGVFCCVTGVSGSGKSSLVSQVLLPALRRKLSDSREPVGAHKQILGISHIDKVIEIDQSPIGRSPRSNPATYTGVFDLVRQLFAKTREAKVRGYVAQRFSFNVKGGRCEACQGQGTRRIEMHFLPDIFVPCAECKGSRYSPETLEIKYRGKSVADILEMRVEEALVFFEPFANIVQLLTALSDVGLAYIALGQAASTLSGGEAQRVKLAAALGKTPLALDAPRRRAATPDRESDLPGGVSRVGHTLYILDEPTTGLHFADIHKLVDVLNRLVAAGHSLVVIEHNLDVIKQADWIIDLGPEGGDAGGRIVAEGPPEEIAANERSYTGQYLRRVLDKSE